ncbi:MAG: holo-ACP synthase [Gemmatimonadetes bacterium]|jgi:holo-[acyl-carrier protein] synthase|nr:holo-ACP synthase [Gemmatimonadota bacterium]MBP6668259.1 holo-ACP synthase [Gemmatimonadales bacterium]MBK6781360.1 holo-ACP synthase [Gemmatimonadota bacterium]MBK7349787.1 holo-ACP synthase [Gemmatimonadota bacterium]MBK7716626.1 holo-ACP synthase [Gemmatimonadota bacterium]
MELIGVGIDLVDIVRVERMLARHGDRVIARFLTDRERAYVVGKYRPAMHIAARIAAKEAAYKALQSLPGARAVSWHHLEVERETEGRPYLVLSGLAHELAERHGPLEIQLSLSHSDATAGAVAVLLRRR